MVSIDNLSVEFSAIPLFEDVSFVINDRDRIALVGKNGAGKSTMLKILCGIQHATSGTVSVPNDITIGYLPQVMKLQDDTTVAEEAYKAFSDIADIEAKVKRLEKALGERTDYDSDEYMLLVDKFTAAHDRYMMMGADNKEAEMERTLVGLGFARSDFNRPTCEFSGGWRMRIELAKILLRKPDVLLLDEPTNHLDIESIQWLEQFLIQSAKAVVLVSHDRAFINNVTNRTLEISCRKVIDYKVKYDEYVKLRVERREQQMRAYENQQKEIADTKAFIERFRYQATKAVQVQQRIRQLEKIVPVEIDEIDTSALRLKFPPCLRSGDYPIICEDVEKSYELTRRWNTVAVVTDGTAVLGLGDIGPEAGMPVMEGKCVLFKAFGDVDAIPLCVRTKDVEEIVKTVSLLAGSFGGVNLEDISAPRCFEIEKRLKEVCDIPIFHDDQHGTAVVTLAGLINALKLTGKKIEEVKIVTSGAGAAGIAIIKLLLSMGAKHVIMTDREGAIYKGRENLNPIKMEMAEITNLSMEKGSLSDVIKNADVFIGVSAPGTLSKDMVKSMAEKPIIFACANPIPEIFPEDAKEAGAAVVSTGRSDFPNQINNVLCFPGIFRGALDVRAKDINDEMKVAAAYAIAGLVSDQELNAEYILPAAFDERVKDAVANAVAEAAKKSGVARV